MSFETKLGRISGRNWEQIAVLWLRAIPIIDPPGSAPIDAVSSTPGLLQIAKVIGADAEVRSNLPPLREAILREGIYLLHKAAHVIGAAELHSKQGLLSWSLSSGYQGAFFAAKAILSLLGISWPEVDNKTILVDVWPGPQKGERKSAKRYEIGCEMQFISVQRLEHRHVWQIVLRVLSRT